jgi:hypothetical protein
MRKFLLVLFLLPLGSMTYCSLPLTSVALLTVTLTDQTGRKIDADATATYLDADGETIVTITSEMPSSWDNNLHWWSHSKYRTSTLRPEDAKRAMAVEVTAKKCEAVKVPVALERQYEPLSFAPHGGGAAYFVFRFDSEVVLRCG